MSRYEVVVSAALLVCLGLVVFLVLCVGVWFWLPQLVDAARFWNFPTW
jgi:hypothetical protein